MKKYKFSLPFPFVKTFGSDVVRLYQITALAYLENPGVIYNILFEWYQYLDEHQDIGAHLKMDECVDRWEYGFKLYSPLFLNHFNSIAAITNYHNQNLRTIKLSDDLTTCCWIYEN